MLLLAQARCRAASAKPARVFAFTLIELLVVIAIMVVPHFW